MAKILNAQKIQALLDDIGTYPDPLNIWQADYTHILNSHQALDDLAAENGEEAAAWHRIAARRLGLLRKALHIAETGEGDDDVWDAIHAEVKAADADN